MSGAHDLEATDDTPKWARDVLDYWFALSFEDWFKQSDPVDAEIAARFSETFAHVSSAPTADLTLTPDTARAAIIVLDQFSRNLFRDDARAFATDEKARQLADHLVSGGHDDGLTPDEMTFIYLPFEHSEDLTDQDRCVALMTKTGNAVYVDFAIKHRHVIARFGRFPHRNEVLGRQTTAEEQAFLDEHGRGF